MNASDVIFNMPITSVILPGMIFSVRKELREFGRRRIYLGIACMQNFARCRCEAVEGKNVPNRQSTKYVWFSDPFFAICRSATKPFGFFMGSYVALFIRRSIDSGILYSIVILNRKVSSQPGYNFLAREFLVQHDAAQQCKEPNQQRPGEAREGRQAKSGQKRPSEAKRGPEKFRKAKSSQDMPGGVGSPARDAQTGSNRRPREAIGGP